MVSSSAARVSRRDLLRAAGLLGLAAACRGGSPERQDEPAPARGPVAFRGAQVYSAGRFEPATVLVDGRHILGLAGPDANVDAEPIDVAGLWLIPGVIDAHVHLQFAGALEILLGGVTTVRDLGSPPGVAADAERDTRLRVLTAGRILTTLKGYPSQSWGADGTSRQIRDEEDAAAAVAEQVEAGASVVKIALEPAEGPIFDPDVLEVIVAAAHEAQLKVTAHVGSPEGLALAITHGVDELAHLPLYDVSPGEMIEVAEAGMVLVPTLEIRGRDVGAVRAVEAFLDAGGTVIYGTDLGNTGTAPGIEQSELRALRDAGMSGAQVLDAATSAAADHLDLPKVGRIEDGAVADMVGLRGDPTADVAAYDKVALVVAGGVRALA